MALVRCEVCGSEVAARGRYKRTYVRRVFPAGHPKSGLVCGMPSCDQPGLIWLERDEARAYDKGTRMFGLQTNATKVRAR